MFLGDSVLWGYKLAPSDAATTILGARFPNNRVLNLSFEGGSSVNSYFMLRYLESRGIRPALVVFNINSKESNRLDSAYKRLHPSLEAVVLPLLDETDRKRIDLQKPKGTAGRLQAYVERIWRLYRYRTDLREALFGADDAATALNQFLANRTGATVREAKLHRPTADRFLGTYDLAPLRNDNVDFIYLRKLGALLKDLKIPAIAILTPTNHKLLSDYIDAPAYTDRLRQAAAPLRKDGITVLDLDATITPAEFLDNDHLTVEGNRRFEKIVEPVVRRALSR